ncbi:DUF2478 domain-containing protein [Mangrovicoccus algicola]|uniref:DUF2478 domain-containing protein n=1 Tax=Mangrovicoccus algicola TaxID=2771008 RepID=A0A8J6Z5X3_9RHOB|nr:DUF2478 domain-containing protein [Mangrovicoccus algicola]MBE3638349.1 DUF2478 domain-containing protein [Mangrovicoccus algicola]
MRIGFVTAEGRGSGDRLLCDLADHLAGRGIRLAGVVQHNTDRARDDGCDMDVTVLPAGPRLRISQSLGTGSRGCRLDAAALEQAVGLVGSRLEAGADLLLVNKFGKHEAEGRGFRDLIGSALMEGLPVIVGVSARNMAAFREFAGDLAEPVPADPAALRDWAEAALGAAAAA